jgi:hypothetical protein
VKLQTTIWPLSAGKDSALQWVAYDGQLPGHELAFDPARMRWSPEAWRWTYLVGEDPVTGRPCAYDVEAFGPITVLG